MPVDEQPHQLRHGDGRVGVVQLGGPRVVERLERPAQEQVQPDHVLQRAAHEEILLLQPQDLALRDLIVRVEHLRDVLRGHLVLHGAVIVAVVEGLEVERLDGLGLPEPEVVAGAHAIAEDGRVVRHAPDHVAGHPADAQPPVIVDPLLGVAAELHLARDFRPRDFPGVPVAQPLVGDLGLPAVLDRLVEDAELVPDAVADRGDVERRHRVDVARGQPSEPAVAEARFLLLRGQLVQVQLQFREGLPHLADNAEVEEVVHEVRAGQELGGQVRHHPGVRAGQRPDSLHAAVEDAVAHGERQRDVQVVAGGELRPAAQRAHEVVDERLSQVRHAHAVPDARDGRGSG